MTRKACLLDEPNIQKEEQMATSFVAGSTANTMIDALKSLYQIPKDINDFIDEHIEKLKQDDRSNFQVIGRVLEGAKEGFGIGFITPIAIISAGQLLLGNPLAVPLVVVTAPFNPLVMTSAAVGALYFGWNALSDDEKTELLEKLKEGLNLGIELIKSIITYVIKKMEQLISCDSWEEVKQWVSSTMNDLETWFSETCGDACKSASNLVKKAQVFFSELFSSGPDSADATKKSETEKNNG